MKITDLNRRAAAAGVLLWLAAPLLAHAQEPRPPAKGVPKLQPRPSVTSGVPAGADLATPGTSRSAELGMPTMPANDAEREELRRASAAARAAARRRAAPASAASAANSGSVVEGAAAKESAAKAPGANAASNAASGARTPLRSNNAPAPSAKASAGR